MDIFTAGDVGTLVQNLQTFSFFADLQGQRFEVMAVTPLMRFSFSDMFLSRVSNELTEKLQRSYRRIKVDAFITAISAPPGVPCIGIIVYLNSVPNFKAYMFTTFKNGPPTHLNLMSLLINKDLRLTNSTQAFITKKFGCFIEKCAISHRQFQWMMGITINETLMRRINEGITLSLVVNGVNSGVLHFTLPPEELCALWSEWVEYGCFTGEVHEEDIELFVRGVCEHFINVYRFDSCDLIVERVIVEGISMFYRDTLKFKIYDTGMLYSLLQFVERAIIEAESDY